MTLYVGEGPRGSNGTHSPLHWTSIFHSATHNQTDFWFPSGWACARLRPLWVSPMTSPVRLGVSPAAAPRAFSIRGLRLYFPVTGALGCAVCFAPRHLSGLSVRECGAVGSASGQTACPVRPTLRQSQSRQGNASPLHPMSVSAPPTGLDVCFFFIFLVSDFLAVRFSGCVRRRSMSTYTAILVLS